MDALFFSEPFSPVPVRWGRWWEDISEAAQHLLSMVLFIDIVQKTDLNFPSCRVLGVGLICK